MLSPAHSTSPGTTRLRGSDPSAESDDRGSASYRASLGDDHPNTLVTGSNLACFMRLVGRVPEALVLAEDTLGRMEASWAIITR